MDDALLNAKSYCEDVFHDLRMSQLGIIYANFLGRKLEHFLGFLEHNNLLWNPIKIVGKVMTVRCQIY